jgi:hypothetical protein
VDDRRIPDPGLAGFPEPAGAAVTIGVVVTIAAWVVLGLVLALVTVVVNTTHLPVRARFLLLLLALVAGILAVLRMQRAL